MSRSTELKISIKDIESASAFLKDYLTPTPLVMNAQLSELFGAEIYLKLENMQPIGAFKLRGAIYKISKLTDAERKKGVIAASAGNHAQGVAWGSKKLGVDALIVMPKNAALVKVQNTKRLGAKVVLEGETYDQAYQAAQKIMKETGRTFVHAYEDAHVIAGQGTVALEILQQLPAVDYIVGSMGGGGLMAGVGIAVKARSKRVKVAGCQSTGAPSITKSIRDKKIVQLKEVRTFADGIAVARASEPMVKLLKDCIDEFYEADEESIASAVLMLMEKAKTLAEGSGAAPLAVLDQMRAKIKGKKVVLIVSGGNIDVNVLARIIDRGLIRAGRRIRVNALIGDHPGSLAELTQLLAKHGANIIQAIHDRSEPGTMIDQTDVALTLETKGPEHSDAVIAALKDHVIKLELVH